MSENGQSHTEPKRSVARDVIGLIEDHIELASFEWQYEKQQGIRRTVVLVVGGVLGICAFAFLQIAIVGGLVRLGLALWEASVGLAVIYGAMAILCFWRFGRRPPQAGEPFEGTRTEIRKNLKWIQQFFS